MKKEAKIKIQNLKFAYSKGFELHIPNLEICEKDFLGIIGPNGSGKTTLLMLIANLLKKYEGNIIIENENIENWNKRELAKIISYVPQNIGGNLDLTVREIIEMGRFAYYNGFQRLSKSDGDCIEKAISLCDCTKIVDKKYSQLSGGEKQRVIIAKVIAQDSNIILLDEPISHLDIYHQLEICQLLKDLNRQGKTIVTILHDINTAAIYCDSLILMNNGEIFHQGSVQEVINATNINNVYNVSAQVVTNKFTNRPFVIHQEM